MLLPGCLKSKIYSLNLKILFDFLGEYFSERFILFLLSIAKKIINKRTSFSSLSRLHFVPGDLNFGFLFPPSTPPA